MIHIFPAVIIQFNLTNAFIPAAIFRLRFNVYYSSIELQRICEGTRFFRNFFFLFQIRRNSVMQLVLLHQYLNL